MVLCLHYSLQHEGRDACCRIALQWLVSIAFGIIAQITQMLMLDNELAQFLWLYKTVLCFLFLVLPIIFANLACKRMCEMLRTPVQGQVSGFGGNKRQILASKMTGQLILFTILTFPYHLVYILMAAIDEIGFCLSPAMPTRLTFSSLLFMRHIWSILTVESISY